MGYFIKKSLHGNEGHVIPSGSTADRPDVPILASLRFNTDTNSLEYFNGTVYVDVAKSGSITPTIENIVTTSTDTYTLSTQPESAEKIAVFINGIYQTPGPTFNYTVSGFDLIFTSVPPVGLNVTVIHGLFDTYVPDSGVFDVPNL